MNSSYLTRHFPGFCFLLVVLPSDFEGENCGMVDHLVVLCTGHRLQACGGSNIYDCPSWEVGGDGNLGTLTLKSDMDLQATLGNGMGMPK